MEKLDSSPYFDIDTAHAFETCIDTVLVQPKTQKGRLYLLETIFIVFDHFVNLMIDTLGLVLN
jgi:hypothetical protein